MVFKYSKLLDFKPKTDDMETNTKTGIAKHVLVAVLMRGVVKSDPADHDDHHALALPSPAQSLDTVVPISFAPPPYSLAI